MFKLKINKDINNSDINNFYIEMACLDTTSTLKKFHTHMSGLSKKEALKRAKLGKNIISTSKEKHWSYFLIKSVIDPFILVLFVLSISTYLIGSTKTDYIGSAIIFVIALISIVIRFTQEYQSHLSSLKLKGLIKTNADVRRGTLPAKKVNVENLVVGDIIELSAGSIIPSDCKIIESNDLFISQALFTGESMPIEKNATYVKKDNVSITEISNICLMGSTVISGTATAVIINIGTNNYIGIVAKSIKEEKEETNFDRGVKKVSYTLIKYMVFIIVAVLLINGIIKGNWLEALLFSISIGVGLTPGMLPMIVNTNLAKGASLLAKKKTIVKNLNAIQNLGAIDILCTDKTGTLTENRIVLQRYFNADKKEDLNVFKYAYFNSYFGTGVKNIIDNAVISYAHEHNVPTSIDIYHKIDEIPFDYERRIMSVVISDKNDNHILVSKGALENILEISPYVILDGKKCDMTGTIKQKITNDVNQLNKEGMHIIAVSIREERVDVKTFSKKDENNMTFVGYIAFLDPLKKDAKSSLTALEKSGVNIKILTGDSEEITRALCNQVGINTDIIMSGVEVDKLSVKELKEKVETCSIFIRMSPLQKNRVIDALQSNEHVVGYMGDGVNDAPSLRSADVGICVDTATDIARESSDLILLEKDLMVLKDGVETGRIIFGNIIKYMKMTLSSNFGNMFSVLIGSIFLPFLPMLPIQILIQNMLYDLSQTTIPWDNVDSDFLSKPQKWDIGDLERYMKSIGVISSIYDLLTYLLLWFVLGYNNISMQSYFQTGWFMEGLISQTLIVHFIRTAKIPFIESNPSKYVTVSTIAVSLSAILIPFLPFAHFIGFSVPGLNFYLLLPVILAMYFLTIEFIKKGYIKRYHRWL